MLIGLIILFGFVVKYAPSTKKARRLSGLYIAFIYLSSIFFFYNQARISWDWGNVFLPLTGLPASALIVGVSTLCIMAVMGYFFQLVQSRRITKVYALTRRNWVAFLLSAVLIFSGALAYSSSRWAMNGIGNMRFDQIVFAMTQPLKGSDPGQIQAFILQPLLEAVLWSTPLISLMYLFMTCSVQLGRKSIRRRVLSTRLVWMLGLFGLVFGISMSAKEIGYADIKAYYFENTEIYENNYVDPKNVELKFPKKKRNLVYIFLESMESSYMSTELGGSQEQNLLPNLSKLSQTEGIHFSNTSQVGGGMLQVPGANQTASSMVAQTSGVPLRPSASFGLSDGSGANSAEYFPGAYSLGEILDKEGYNQTLLIGSKAEFAGRDKYFQQHGNYEIRDYHWAIEQGLIPEDYYVWWGYEDNKLFDFAKDTLNELSAKDEPFNFTMLTADTHFEDGYATEETPDLFGDQYSNVIHESDRQLMAFLSWMKEQPFYENTTVILCGDHLTMDSDFFDELDPEYQRSVFNLFLNTNKKTVNNQNRQFSAMDMFPTTLSALGVKISGNRLGLGTNLFSKEPTIIEKLGYDTFESELMKRSKFYDEKLIMNNPTTESE